MTLPQNTPNTKETKYIHARCPRYLSGIAPRGWWCLRSRHVSNEVVIPGWSWARAEAEGHINYARQMQGGACWQLPRSISCTPAPPRPLPGWRQRQRQLTMFCAQSAWSQELGNLCARDCTASPDEHILTAFKALIDHTNIAQSLHRRLTAQLGLVHEQPWRQPQLTVKPGEETAARQLLAVAGLEIMRAEDARDVFMGKVWHLGWQLGGSTEWPLERLEPQPGTEPAPLPPWDDEG